MKRLIIRAIFVCTVMLTFVLPLNADEFNGRFVMGGIGVRFVMNQDRLPYQLRYVTRFREDIKIRDLTEHVPDNFAVGHFSDIVHRVTAKPNNYSLWREYFWQMLGSFLSEQSPRLNKFVSRRCAFDTEFKISRSGVAAILHWDLLGSSPSLITVLAYDETGLAEENKSPLAYNESRICRLPLLISKIRGKASSDGYNYNENKLQNAEHFVIFLLGIAMIVSGIWCAMFVAPKHGMLFLLIGVLALIAGWLLIPFADVVANAFPFYADTSMLPHSLGIGA